MHSYTQAKKSFISAIRSIKDNPKIYAPFLIFAALELVALILFYLAPRQPLRAIFGPLIATLWDERFLHYPMNFLLLPKLAGLSRMVLSVVIGSLLTGVAVARLYKKSATVAFKKYANLFIIIFIIIAAFYWLNKIVYILFLKYFAAGHQKLLFLSAGVWLGPINVILSQIFALVMQAAFIYAIPALIIGDKKFYGAIAESAVFFKRHFLTTLILVGLPMLTYVPLVVLNYNSSFLITRLFPEFILWLGILNIIVNSLFIDPVMTLGSAAFYLEKRKT